ncbi:5781_t:CDS:2 [Rhizophagus irregularis]|nr:5781_t:CDS:2 [Rhizophagus irregularis]
MSTFRIGPVVSSLFYSKGRDSIPSFTGPFKSLQEFYGTLIQKEKEFFEIHGAQELLPFKESKIDHGTAVTRVKSLIKQLGLLQSKLSNIFDELVEQKPFILIHGTLWDLCKYPIWIQEIDELPISDANLQENYERRILRKFFYEEMSDKFINISSPILNKQEQVKFFYHYGSEAKANIKLADPIMRLFWRPSLTKVQIPSEETIQDILSDTESNYYVASVYCELKSRGYNFTWQQPFVIAFHMLNNESSPKEKFV